MIGEFKNQSEIDEAYAEEISKAMLTDVLNESLDPILARKSIIGDKLHCIFLKKDSSNKNNENIFFQFEEKEEINVEYFKNKHINELLKMMYNTLIALVKGIFN